MARTASGTDASAVRKITRRPGCRAAASKPAKYSRLPGGLPCAGLLLYGGRCGTGKKARRVPTACPFLKSPIISGRFQRHAQVFGPNLVVVVRQHEGPLHPMLKLPHVPGPGMLPQEIRGQRAEEFLPGTALPAKALEEVLGQSQNVLRTAAQGRQLQRKDRQTV